MQEIESIKSKIYTIRDQQVIIDKDLSTIYQVSTKALNQAVKRNIDRFPSDFMFQINKNELEELVTICDRLSLLKHSSSLPYAFTQEGIAMLSSVLRSKTAIQINIQIMKTFVLMRKVISQNTLIYQKINNIEKKQLIYDTNFEKIFNALENKEPKQGIFFNGQIFDAHYFISNLIRKAEKSIILIDNYIDDTTLNLLTKRKKEVYIILYTNHISKQLSIDLKKFNSQYEPIQIKEIQNFHDRFLIIDNNVYHIGASLKDTGKKVFAFSKFNKESFDILKGLIGK